MSPEMWDYLNTPIPEPYLTIANILVIIISVWFFYNLIQAFNEATTGP